MEIMEWLQDISPGETPNWQGLVYMGVSALLMYLIGELRGRQQQRKKHDKKRAEENLWLERRDKREAGNKGDVLQGPDDESGGRWLGARYYDKSDDVPTDNREEREDKR